MIDSLPPGSILMVGALIAAMLRGRGLRIWMILIPLVSLAHLLWVSGLIRGVTLGTNERVLLSVSWLGYALTPVRLDGLSMVWGLIFHIAAILGVVYALHHQDKVEWVSALVYAGAAIGAVFAGDLITLFVYWELTAVSSVFIVWAGRSERSYHAGMRYLVVQVGSGVILLAGILLHYARTQSLAFDRPLHEFLFLTDGMVLGLNSPGTILIFIAFGIKAAFPLLHNWLEDAYPEASPSGTVFLSAFTTKLAIYALARGFPGTGILIWIGAAMTAFPIFYAVIENDLRRVLAYSLNNQLGFMVVGVGIGTGLSLNGTASHAFAHILYKALLFMSMGAVLWRTGTAKGSELGGLYKSMPWTMVFCCVGAASISAFPLFSGFVTKSLILSETANNQYTFVWLVLLFASAGVFHHSGIKIPYFAFFAHDSGKRVREAPTCMLWAMGITASLCVLIGVRPELLYGILPYPVAYPSAYAPHHVIEQLQLLLFSALAFTVLNRWKIYPPELRSVNLDWDWIYRKPLPALVRSSYSTAGEVRRSVADAGLAAVGKFVAGVEWLHNPRGILGRTWSTGTMVTWAALLLMAFLLLYYF